MTLKSAQEHHRRAEELYRESEDLELIQVSASMAIAGYLEEIVQRLDPALAIAELPKPGQTATVRAI